MKFSNGIPNFTIEGRNPVTIPYIVEIDVNEETIFLGDAERISWTARGINISVS